MACENLLLICALSRPRSWLSLFSLVQVSVFFKCLLANQSVLSQDVVRQLHNLYTLCCQANPKLMSNSVDEVEEEANSYFHKLYTGALSVEDMVSMLQRFKGDYLSLIPLRFQARTACFPLMRNELERLLQISDCLPFLPLVCLSLFPSFLSLLLYRIASVFPLLIQPPPFSESRRCMRA